MKKSSIYFGAILITTMVLFTTIRILNTSSAKQLFAANVDALCQGGNPDDSEHVTNPGDSTADSSEFVDPGPDGWTRGACQHNGGNWNMATVWKETQNMAYTCTISGKIKAGLVEFDGNYSRGNNYSFSVVSYTCIPTEGNCCIKQGAYIGNTKIG